MKFDAADVCPCNHSNRHAAFADRLGSSDLFFGGAYFLSLDGVTAAKNKFNISFSKFVTFSDLTYTKFRRINLFIYQKNHRTMVADAADVAGTGVGAEGFFSGMFLFSGHQEGHPDDFHDR